MSQQIHEVETRELGWCNARLETDADSPNGEADFLLLYSPSTHDETHHAPPSDVRIFQRRNILKLRDFLNMKFPPPRKNPNA